MQKTITRWAIHKSGTDQLGYLCSFKREAEDMLNDMHKNIITMSEEDKNKYHVIEVKVSWDEDIQL